MVWLSLAGHSMPAARRARVLARGGHGDALLQRRRLALPHTVPSARAGISSRPASRLLGDDALAGASPRFSNPHKLTAASQCVPHCQLFGFEAGFLLSSQRVKLQTAGSKERERFLFFIKDYEPEYYWWEIIEMLRKVRHAALQYQ